VAATDTEQRDRLRFIDFKIHELPNGRRAARVVLGWSEDDQFVGEAEGDNSAKGAITCAAEATVRALEQSVNGISLDLQGVETIEAYETVVVIVWISCQIGDRSLRLVGSQIIEENPSRWERISSSQVIEEKPFRGAALAVLKATNRLVALVFKGV
jgi:hypothetical protein